MRATSRRTGRLEPSKASMQRGGRILEKSRKAELQKLRSREQKGPAQAHPLSAAETD